MKKQPQYHKWSQNGRYSLGKYVAENGNMNALTKFKTGFPKLNESAVRSFKKKYYEELGRHKKEEFEASQRICKYSRQTSRPALLGEVDEMVSKYLLSLSKSGGVVNTTVANATAKALMSKYPDVVGQVDVDSLRWAKSLSSRMSFIKQRKTSSKVDISDGARKKIEFLYLHDVVSKAEKYDVPSALVLNIDQTPLKYVPVGNETMAAKGEHSMTVEGKGNKRSIIGTFAISFEGNFLPVQLIYGGRAKQSLPSCLNFQKNSASAQIPNIFQTRMNCFSS